MNNQRSGEQQGWHILGAGAMGCLWAARLAQGGRPPRLLLRQAWCGETTPGITLEEHDNQSSYPVEFEHAASAGTIHRLLVATKAQDVLTAVNTVEQRLHPGCIVVLLSNGMGFQHQLQDAHSQLQVCCAVTTEGAWLRQPFHVVHAGHGDTLVGSLDASKAAAAAAACEELGYSGLTVRIDAAIEVALWRKLAVNCVINPLTALHQCVNGALLDDPGLHASMTALTRETADLLRHLGYAQIAGQLTDDVVRIARATAANSSSMAQDLARGRPTEIDHITGYLCRQAADAGLAYPLNAELYEQIKAREPRCAGC